MRGNSSTLRRVIIVIIGFASIIVRTFRTQKKLNYKFIYRKPRNSISCRTIVLVFMSCGYAKESYLFTLKPFKNNQLSCARPKGVYIEYENRTSLRFPGTGKILACEV